MAFNHQNWNEAFVLGPNYNDAIDYGVTIFRHQLVKGERYWKIIGVHHLTPEENRGNHNLFFDVLDKNGNRIRPVVWVHWTWKGMRQDEVAAPAQGDKPDSEPVGNIGIGGNQIIYAKCTGRSITEDADGFSDWINDIHTNHPDEGDTGGNTIGHHSFYVVWQETIAGGTIPEPIPEPKPVPDPGPIDNVIGSVTIWQDDQPLKFIVPWKAEVYSRSPDGPYLEAVVDKESLQRIIDEVTSDEVKLYIQLKSDDET